jgi:hypothetical protein
MMRFRMLRFLLVLLFAANLAFAQAKPRTRDLGVPFHSCRDGRPRPSKPSEASAAAHCQEIPH